MNKLIPRYKKGNNGFSQAFAQARKAGEKEFEYKGKKYNTRYKGESDENWKKSWKSNDQSRNVPEYVSVNEYKEYPTITEDFAKNQLQALDYQVMSNPDYVSAKFGKEGSKEWNKHKDNSELGFDHALVEAMRMALNKQKRYADKEVTVKVVPNGLSGENFNLNETIAKLTPQKDTIDTPVLASSIVAQNDKFREGLKTNFPTTAKIDNNSMNVFKRRMEYDVNTPGELVYLYDSDNPSIYDSIFTNSQDFTFDDYKNLIGTLRDLNKTNPDLVSDYINNVFGTDWNNEDAYNYIRNYETTNPEDYIRLKNQYGQDTQGLYKAIYETSLSKSEPKKRLRPYE